MQKKQIPLVLASAFLLALTSCGEPAPEASSSNVDDSTASSASPIDSGSETPSPIDSGDSSEPVKTSALERALKKNYSNCTISVGSIAGGDESSGLNFTDYHKDGYDAIYDVAISEIYDETTYYFFHDYNGVSYRYFDDDDEPGAPAWLASTYDGASQALKDQYWSLDYFLSSVEVADFTYQSGVWLFTNTNKFESIINDAFRGFYETEMLYLAIQLDGDYITKIQAFGDDAEKDLVDIDITNIASTSFPEYVTLPTAPSADNVKEYWQYKGWDGPQIHVYPKTITMEVTDATPNDENVYTVEIEKALSYKVSVVYDIPEGIDENSPRIVKENEITFRSSDETIAKVDYLLGAYSRQIVGVAAGDAEIWAEGEAAEGKAATASNHVKVHVNSLAKMDMTDAAYSITFDSTSGKGVSPSCTNSINSTLPFDVEVSNGVQVLDGPTNSLFDGKKVMQLSTGTQESMNETFQDESVGGDAVAAFDFDDQQVSGIAFYYGSIYGNSYKADYVTKIAIEAKNPSQTWDEAEVIDITDEVKTELSSKNLHLMQKSFSPASQVRIVMRSVWIGDSMEMGVDNFVFASNSSCTKHFVADATPVTSVSIAAAGDATSVRLGKTLQFSAGVKPNNASDKSVTWNVSDSSIATISETGLLTPVKEGTVTVSATSYHGATAEGVKSNEIEITVKEAAAVASGLIGTWIEEDYPSNNKIAITSEKATLTFNNGDVVELPFTDVDDDGYCIFGTFTDKNTAGYLKAKISTGYESKMEYSYNVSGTSATHTKNVYSSGDTISKQATGMSLSANRTALKVGDKTTGKAVIKADFTPSGAYEEEWTLTSPNTSVVKVVTTDDEGNETQGASSDMSSGAKSIVAVGTGGVTLTATSESGFTATIEVTVTEPKKVTSISVSLSATTVEENKTVNATATVNPTDADDASFTWSVVNGTGKATVDKNGLVTAKSAGTVTIVATANDGSGVTGQATLTITAASGSSTSFNGTYTASDTTGYELEMTFVVTSSSCEVTFVDASAEEGTGELDFVSSNGNVYTYSGEFADTCYGDIQMTVVIDFDDMTVTVTLDNGEGGLGYYDSNFVDAAITKA